MKEKIDVFDYAGTILKAIPKGVLLTTKAGDKTNSMVIGWGSLGTKWGKTIVSIFVREHRCTRELLDENPEFTINIPIEGRLDKEIMKVCGAQSGHEKDKFKELGLIEEASNQISVPGIRQVPLTIECKVIYRQKDDKEAISDSVKTKFYPEDVPVEFHGENKDFHVSYIGEVVDAYIIK